MAYKENKELKLYYSISEVAELFDVQPSLLRYWETQFPQIAPRKAGRNIRQYTKEDIEQIRLIYNLVKERGMKLDAAAKLLRTNKQGVERKSEALEKLQEVREELLALRRSLSAIE